MNNFNDNTKIMKSNTFILLFAFATSHLFFSGCSISNQSMKYPNYHIEFYKGDFEYSPQVKAEATSVRILMIDWQRLLTWQSGQIDLEGKDEPLDNVVVNSNIVTGNIVGGISALIPVMGDYMKGRVASYALYNLMEENPGYDLVIYPQYKTKKFIIPFFYSKRTVEVTAGLGKIK